MHLRNKRTGLGQILGMRDEYPLFPDPLHFLFESFKYSYYYVVRIRYFIVKHNIRMAGWIDYGYMKYPIANCRLEWLLESLYVKAWRNMWCPAGGSRKTRLWRHESPQRARVRQGTMKHRQDQWFGTLGRGAGHATCRQSFFEFSLSPPTLGIEEPSMEAILQA